MYWVRDWYFDTDRTPSTGRWSSSSLLPNIITKLDQTIFNSSKMLRKIVGVAASHLVYVMQVIQQKINVMSDNGLRKDDGRSLFGSD